MRSLSASLTHDEVDAGLHIHILLRQSMSGQGGTSPFLRERPTVLLCSRPIWSKYSLMPLFMHHNVPARCSGVVLSAAGGSAQRGVKYASYVIQCAPTPGVNVAAPNATWTCTWANVRVKLWRPAKDLVSPAPRPARQRTGLTEIRQ